MAQEFFWRNMGKIWGRTLALGILVAGVSFMVLMAVAPRFVVSSDYLIVQNQGESQDAYAAFKSLDYLGKVLNESAYSERFIGAVTETGQVNVGFLPSNSYDRLKAWKKMVTVTRNADAGILHVEVRADDQRMALSVSQAISDVLVQKNSLFRSGDDRNVEVRILSGPILSRNPDTSGMLLILIGGFLLGVCLVVLWVLIRMEIHRQRLERLYFDLTQTPAPPLTHDFSSRPATAATQTETDEGVKNGEVA